MNEDNIEHNKTFIQIVEDEMIIARDLKISLELLGYKITSISTSGEEAIKNARLEKPDLILMDIVLQGKMDGIMAAEVIKDEFRTPIIYLTAYSDESVLSRAKITEPFGFLIKPIEDRELHTNIEMALYKSRLEKRLRESEERYRLLFNSAPDGIEELDSSGNIIDCNESFARMLGFTSEKIIGKNISTFINEESEIEFQNKYPVSIKNNEQECEIFLNHKEGHLIPVWRKTKVITDSDDNVLGAVAYNRDITEIKKNEEMINHKAFHDNLTDLPNRELFFQSSESQPAYV